MTGAVRIIPSQPLGFPAPKTASGGKIRARRVAPERMPRNRLYRLRKIYPCNYDPTGQHILGNTIGNAVAGDIAQQDNTAAQGQDSGVGSFNGAVSNIGSSALMGDIPTYADGLLLNPSGESGGLILDAVDTYRDFDQKGMIIASIHSDISNLQPGQTLPIDEATLLSKLTNIDPYQPFFIGGGGDSVSHIVYDYAGGSLEQIRADGYSAGANYGIWSDGQRINDYIEIATALGQTTTLIGHSYGGYAAYAGAMYAANRDIDLDALITIDPVVTNYARLFNPPTVAQAGDVKAHVGTWIDVRSTTSDNGFPDSNDAIKLLGGPMSPDIQAVSNPNYFQTSQYDHGQFPQMYNKYAKNFVVGLYR